MRIPETGVPKDALFAQIDELRKNDLDWRSGRTFAYIFDGGPDVEDVSKKVYAQFLSENALDPTVYPSLLRFEKDIVRMLATHMGGDDKVVGSFTSGGTESILLAVKTARDHARATKPHITAPEMVLPVTAHAAFHKAAHYFGVKVVPVPFTDGTYRADPDAARNAITDNTILLVGSAPSYAHGVIDPIEELGQIALERGVLFHVDACMGGFLLPYFRRLGRTIRAFDFGVPGVTSMSVDLHKYAYAAKGASLVLYADKSLRRHQIFACSSWTGYSLVNTTVQSTKSGGPLAAAWAVLNFVGDEGYVELARRALSATDRLIAGVRAIPDLYVLGEPDMSLVSFSSETVSAFHIADELQERRWHVQPQLTFGSSRANIHLTVGAANDAHIDAFVEDLRAAVDAARGKKGGQLTETVRRAFAGIDPATLTDDAFSRLLGMAGVQGTALPGRMADVNEILDALPPTMRDRLLTEFVNQMFA